MGGDERFVNGHAVVIGVGGDLPVTERDAQAMHDVLADPGRGAYPPERVRLLLGPAATRVAVLDALDQLSADVAADPGGVALVYYSGHGGRAAGDGQPDGYFLVPNGFDPADRAGTGISDVEFSERLAALEALDARRLLVFLDCCHAGGLPGAKAAGATFTPSPMAPALLALLAQGSGHAVVASSREDELSYVGKEYSVFTECLLEALAGHGAGTADGFARLLNVLAYLFVQVPKRASHPQHPFVNKIAGLSENFPICYYAGGAKALPPAAAAEATPLPMPDWKRADLLSRRATLARSLGTYRAQLDRLQQALDIAIDPLVTYRYEQQVLERKAMVETAVDELAAVDAALG